jgi:DNA-binding MarR family transcriptional regulator
MQTQSAALAEGCRAYHAKGADSVSAMSKPLASRAHCRCLGGVQTTAQFVRRLIMARGARQRFFSDDLFADPAWDILLELYALHCEQRRTSVSKLTIAAGIPGTTALRWLEKLSTEGLIVRREDHLDARRVWIDLSDAGLVAMESYLEQLSFCSMPL